MLAVPHIQVMGARVEDRCLDRQLFFLIKSKGKEPIETSFIVNPKILVHDVYIQLV